MPESIRELTQAIAAGDTEAFGRFYDQWFGAAYAEARRASGGRPCGGAGDEAFCLDVVQETMMRVIRAMPPLDSEASLHAWLRIVVRSCCMDLLRRESRRARRERKVARNRPEGVEHAAKDDERLAWMHAALAQLPAPQAGLLSMRYRLGWTLQRIGAALGLSAGAVDGRLSRIIAALQAKAKEDLHE